MKGYVTRKRIVHEVRKEYLDICATLEPGFDPNYVHWPRKDVLCSPLWGTTREGALPQNQSQTNLLPQLQEGHVQEVLLTEDGATPSRVTESTEESVPVHTVATTYGLTAPTLEHEEQRDGSVSPPLAVVAKYCDEKKTDLMTSLPAASDHVEQGITSPPGGLQASTLGSVSDLTVSLSQLSLSGEEDNSVKSDSKKTSMQEEGTNDSASEQEEEKESIQVLTQSTSTNEQCRTHSMTASGSPPKTVPIEERLEVQQEEEICESQRNTVHARGDGAGPDVPEELFFREISAIISNAEQEGKSYEELKAQLELELVWVKQAIHSRQQVSV